MLCIGGDGTVHEALNGLALAGLLGKVPVGVVCGGTGNGLATSLGHEDPRVAVLSLLQGVVSSNPHARRRPVLSVLRDQLCRSSFQDIRSTLTR